MDPVIYQPIGIVRSPHTSLAGIEGFTRLILLYPLHKSSGFSLSVTPFLDTIAHGVFATRVPPPPPESNGFSVVRLLGRSGCTLEIDEVDILDGTPVLDIKPYVPQSDAYPNESPGWFAGKLDEIEAARSDDRFSSR